MDINEMTEEQILQHLHERWTPKSKLGGALRRAGELKKGEICWVEMKVIAQNMSFVELESPTQPNFQMQIHPSRIVEINVPERPARRRMTAAEASEQLEEGQEVWVKCSVSLSDPIDKRQPLRVAFDYLGSSRLLLAETQIEVDA